MSYLNSPSIEIVATKCFLCNRPLLDANSVESGIGPICKKKIGYFDENSQDDYKYENIGISEIDNAVLEKLSINDCRGAVNSLINFCSRCIKDKELIIKIVKQIDNLGYKELSKKIFYYICDIIIEQDNDLLYISYPKDRRMDWVINKNNGKWDSKLEKYIINKNNKKRIWGAFKKFFPGSFCIGPKGVFKICQQNKK